MNEFERRRRYWSNERIWVSRYCRPYQEICKRAHPRDIRIIPLIGPSSILMALMASGLNGQQFTLAIYQLKKMKL